MKRTKNNKRAGSGLNPGGLSLTMTKPRSPLMVTIAEDPADSHFMNVRVIKRGTGEVVKTHYILGSDREQWTRMYERDGFRVCK